MIDHLVRDTKVPDAILLDYPADIGSYKTPTRHLLIASLAAASAMRRQGKQIRLHRVVPKGDG